MKDKYYFIAFGELCLDKTYNKNNELVSETGGISAFNALYNLGLSGEQAYAVGAVGNDENGQKALNYLRVGNVNTDNIEQQNKATNVFHIIMKEDQTDDSSVISESSPLSHKDSYELSKTIKSELPEQFENRNIILIVSNFENTTRDFIEDTRKKAQNAVVSLDITKDKIFRNLPKEYLEYFLSNVNLIQVNQKFLPVLYEKLGISSDEEFIRKFEIDLLTVTKGVKGARFVYTDSDSIRVLERRPIAVRKIKDPTGAGDAFHAMILKAYHKNLIQGKSVDDEFLNKAFVIANNLAGRVVTIVGARGTIKTIRGIDENLDVTEDVKIPSEFDDNEER